VDRGPNKDVTFAARHLSSSSPRRIPVNMASPSAWESTGLSSIITPSGPLITTLNGFSSPGVGTTSPLYVDMKLSPQFAALFYSGSAGEARAHASTGRTAPNRTRWSAPAPLVVGYGRGQWGRCLERAHCAQTLVCKRSPAQCGAEFVLRSAMVTKSTLSIDPYHWVLDVGDAAAHQRCPFSSGDHDPASAGRISKSRRASTSATGACVMADVRRGAL
jgi:hypothetical protein